MNFRKWSDYLREKENAGTLEKTSEDDDLVIWTRVNDEIKWLTEYQMFQLVQQIIIPSQEKCFQIENRWTSWNFGWNKKLDCKPAKLEKAVLLQLVVEHIKVCKLCKKLIIE